jgi:hypothetical protein
MVQRYVQDNGHGLTILVNLIVKGLFLCLTLDLIVFVTNATMLESWLL